MLGQEQLALENLCFSLAVSFCTFGIQDFSTPLDKKRH